jgi:hypothetical protein
MRPFAYRRIVIVLFGTVLLACSSLNGQDKKDQAKEPPKDQPTVLNFWQLDAGLGTEAAAQMIGAANPLGALGARMLASDDAAALPGWRFVFDEPLPIYHCYLEAIQDRRPLPNIRVEKDKPPPDAWVKPGSPDWGWYRAFNEALRRADEADLDMFKKAAKENEDVVYSHLKATPGRYRGKIITITGKLSVIRREDPPRFVPDSIDRIYTGYITGPTPGAPPYAIAFTQLPDDVEKPSEELNLEVTFHGYFLSLVTFPAETGSKTQKKVISPYLVGKTLIVKPKRETATEGPYSFYLIVGIVGGFVIVALLVAAMNIWFRRGDRRIRSQLAAMREKNRPFHLEPTEAEPEPAAETLAANMTPKPHTPVEPGQIPGRPNPPATT